MAENERTQLSNKIKALEFKISDGVASNTQYSQAYIYDLMKCVEGEAGSKEAVERLHNEIRKQQEEIERLKARNGLLEFEERRISRIAGLKYIENMNSPLSIDKSWQGTQKLVTSAHSLPLNVDLSRRPDDQL